MKVICVTHENFHGLQRDNNLPHPEIGEIVTVIGEGSFFGIDCYMLQEYKPPLAIIEWGYDKRNFAPLDSDLDETKLVTEEFEEKYCVPVNHEPCV